jgi:hypothetical protein
MPPSIAECQDAFAAALLDPGLPVPPGVTGPDGFPDARRFAVYRNNVVHSLVNALQARFPVTTRLVGEQFFRAMARVYAVARPPRTPLLMHYGDGFPRFIAGFAPARTVPYLPDIARLERAWSQAFHAAEATPLPVDSLAHQDPERLSRARLHLHPSLRLLRSPHPVATIWSAHQTAGEVNPPPVWEAEDVLIVRPHAEVKAHLLPSSAHDFIVALAAGATVDDAGAAARASNTDFNAGHHLVGLVELGAVVSIDSPSEPVASQGDST